MTHVHTFAPPPAADLIHAAITRHRVALDAYRDAPSLITNDDADAAAEALVATACTTRFGALALLDHLRRWLAEEIAFAAGHGPTFRIAQARVADLTLFLGTNLPPVAIGRALPSGRMVPSPGDPERIGLPLTRALAAGAEAMAALAIIAGGAVLTGLTTLL